MTEKQPINAVFEGGGVKGVGLVGAVAVTEEQGYQFESVAGTSAGAIVAAMLAAGYTAKDMKDILDELNYNDLKDRSLIDKIPLFGPVASITFEKGLYEGRFFEDLMGNLLDAKGIRTFGDLINEEYPENSKFL